MAVLHLSREELQALADLHVAAKADVPSSFALDSAMTKVATNLSVEKHRAAECRPLARLAAQRATEVL